MKIKTSTLICFILMATFLSGALREAHASQLSNNPSQSQVTSAYPNFNWDTVPVYAHFGRTKGDLSHEENLFIASHYDFVTLEKGHGLKKHGSSEKGIIAGAKALKQLNPNMKVLFYWNGLLDYSLYDAHDTFSKIKNGAIKTKSGELDLKRGHLKKYDLANPEVRSWWIKVANDAIQQGQLDGVFIDALPQISIKPEVSAKRLGTARFKALEEGVIKLLDETSATLGAEKLIIYNGIRSIPGGWEDGGLRYLNHANGVIVEHFDQFQSRSKEMIQLDMERMMQAAKTGKIVIFKAWPGFNFTDKQMMKKPEKELYELAKKAIDFPLACFLVIAQPYSYFNNTWGYRDHHGALQWYPELDRKLGAPLSDAKQEGWTYTREFEHASVVVNIDTKTAKITWGQHEDS
ncbi:putative glycoside hydrolase [Aliiglaciecola lipolytica]|uniref:putative glycoside hydrolase n=1 Tax=Aliiglaciecola lipolytica TaxID=477689 RepID=UPI001C09815C|nr:putative glycoside hydrolase [Aliiglaciecola lipolytica]MBU2877946.1 putative glycoside hydrolase family 15 protein [Aliiglaciecola lipolytica]